MRELGTLPNADSARRLADYLRGQSIETRLDESPEGCVLWVLDEDRLPQARKELEQYLSNPSDPRYLLTAQQQAPPPPPVKNEARRVRRRGPRTEGPVVPANECRITWLLILLSVLATVL